MKKKRLLLMGFSVVFLAVALCGLSYGDDGKNFRSGANVKVVADETITGELVAAGANVEVQGKVEDGLKTISA